MTERAQHKSHIRRYGMLAREQALARRLQHDSFIFLDQPKRADVRREAWLLSRPSVLIRHRPLEQAGRSCSRVVTPCQRAERLEGTLWTIPSSRFSSPPSVRKVPGLQHQ